MPRAERDPLSTSRRASAPRRQWPRRWRLEAWSFQDVEVVAAASGAPSVLLRGAARRPGGGARRQRGGVTHAYPPSGGGGSDRRMTLPDWAAPLPAPEEQRELDEWAINEKGIAGAELMEWAGTGLADLVATQAPSGTVAVVCGKGNNGGDGFVAARLLRERGREVRVLALAPLEELQGDARVNCERLPGDAPEQFDAGGPERRRRDHRRGARYRLCRRASRTRTRRHRGDQRRRSSRWWRVTSQAESTAPLAR